MPKLGIDGIPNRRQAIVVSIGEPEQSEVRKPGIQEM
jgi:hypothetical protein